MTESSFLLAYLFGTPGPMELLIIAIIILILFGNRLPGVMRSLGRGVVEFRKGLQGIEDNSEQANKPAATSQPAQKESTTA